MSKTTEPIAVVDATSAKPPSTSLTQLFRGLGSEWTLLGAIVAVIGLTVLLDPQRVYFRMPGASIQEIIRQTSLLGIFAIGSAIVIIAGGIDLSSGSVIAFSGSVFAALLLLMDPAVRNADHPVSSTVLISAALGTLVVGLLIGSLHAWLITVINLPPFVATLATLVGLRSLARVLINDVVPNFVPSQSGSQINIARNQFVDLAQNVWFLAAVFLVVALACWVLMSKTVVGRHLHALGGNEQAARLSGIRTDRLKWLAYCISALLASVAGILYVGDSTLADPQTAGQGYELNAIAAAVVGGCSLMGGIGTVPGTVLGALFLRVVMDAVNKIVNKNAAVYEGLIVGSVVVLAVAFSQVRLAWQRGKPFFAGPLGLVTILNMSLGTGILAIVLAADARWARSLGAGKLGLFAAMLMAVILSVLRILEARGRARLAARTVSGTIRS